MASPEHAATPAKIEAILALIESGESENAACKKIGIARGTFRSAVLRYNVADSYARATEALARDQVEKMETTIEEMRDGTIDVQMARVELDARKWLASKLWKPTWGDKIMQELSGPDGGAIQTEAKLDVSGLTDEQLRALASIRV